MMIMTRCSRCNSNYELIGIDRNCLITKTKKKVNSYKDMKKIYCLLNSIMDYIYYPMLHPIHLLGHQNHFSCLAYRK